METEPELKYKQSDLPMYHLVQTCIPKDIPLDECHEKGNMFIVVGQEIYDDSPFTKKIHKIMDEDVS